MLVEFRVENFRSLREEQVLTFERAARNAEGDDRPRLARGHATELLPVAAVYGANASGKSNVLRAMAFAQSAVAYSHRVWSPDAGVPQEPFAWGDGPDRPSTFEFTVVVDGVRHQYGFVCDRERFCEEWLYAWPHGRKQTWFERDGDRFKFGEHLHGENRVVEDVTRPNSLYLSTAAQHRHPQLTAIYGWFRRVAVQNVNTWPSRSSHDISPRQISSVFLAAQQFQLHLWLGEESSPTHQELLRDLLRAADLGITDLKVERDEDGDRGRMRVYLGHRAQGPAETAWLPLDEESAGTRTLFRIAPQLVHTLELGGLLVIDELEASLHPLLALQLVRLFNSRSSNPRNAQLLFSTHDTNLLGTMSGSPPLRRDQVWFTEKDEFGGTNLYPLTDYQPRREENLERGYLQGRYGAIPFLGELPPLVD